MNAVDRTKAGVASGTLSMTPDGRRHVRRRRARRAGRRRRPPRPRAVAARACPHAARERLVDGARLRRRGAAARRRRSCARAQPAFVDALGTGLTIAASRRPLAAVARLAADRPGRPRRRGAESRRRGRPAQAEPRAGCRLGLACVRAGPHRGRRGADRARCASATSSSGSTSSTRPTSELERARRGCSACTRSRSRTRASSRQRPKLDRYDDHVLLVFYTARATGDAGRPAAPIEVHVYISGDFIVTVRREPLRRRSTSCTTTLGRGADAATRRSSSTASSTR